MDNPEVSASQILRELVEKYKDKEVITIKEIAVYLSRYGFAILMILFAFPMAIPLPYPPGFTSILGAPLLLFSVQMLIGMEEPHLPAWVANKTMKVRYLEFAVSKTEKYFVYLESKFKKRILYFSSPAGERIIGFVSLLCSISIVLPIMFGNAFPSAGVCIMALGLLSRDGLVIIIGIIVSILGLFIAAFVVYLFFWGASLATEGFLKDIYLYIINHVEAGTSLFGDHSN